jgi:small subunit ribosomal protein S16
VAVKIKLKRLGKIRAPYYRIVVADSRTKRDGRAIEEIGKYHPKNDPSFIEVDSERAQHWLSVGAQPTDPVRKILEITGDWQKFKGLPGTEGTLRVAEPKADRKLAFAAALQETLDDSGATTKGKPRGKAAESATPKAGKPDTKADTAKADTAKAEKPAKADKPKAPAEPAKAEPAKAEAEPAKAEAAPAKAETAPAKAEAEPAKAEAEPAKSESAKAEAAEAEPAKAEAEAEPAKAEAAPADAAADSAPSEG